MTKADRLRVRIADVTDRIAGQQTMLAELGEAGRPTELAWDLLARLIEIRNTYREALSWSELPRLLTELPT